MFVFFSKMKNILRISKIHNQFLRLYATHPRTCPEFDFQYLCNDSNFQNILNNIKMRKGIGDIEKVRNLYKSLVKNQREFDWSNSEVTNALIEEAKRIPNTTHPDVQNYGTEPKIIKFINKEPQYTNEKFKPKEFSEICRYFNMLRVDGLGNFTGHRSYYFMDSLAELEEALLKYSVRNLLNKGFQLISVPDILPRHLIESCGMTVVGDRTQVI